jgi:hypothetical protein
METNQERRGANHEWMIAEMDSLLEKMKACLEKKEAM